jgi:hypothetical protein
MVLLMSATRSYRCRLETLLTALVAGVSIALPLYLWQASYEVAIASFVIVGYTVWLWAWTRSDIVTHESLRRHLCGYPVNRPLRRTGRLVRDASFWWSIIVGGATVTGSVWYAGMRDIPTIAGIGGMWSMIAVALSYGATLRGPTTRCRKCGYQLAAHLDPNDPQQVVNCPECGRQWSKSALCLMPVRMSA